MALYEDLRVKVSCLQFYAVLTRAHYDSQEWKALWELNDQAVSQMIRMRDLSLWDGKYDFIFDLSPTLEAALKKAKSQLGLEQTGSDEQIAAYIQQNPSFFQMGIELKSLSLLCNVDRFLKQGHMLQDLFAGYQEKHFPSFYVDCLEYVHAASHFYNEAYEYYAKNKEVKTYDQIPHSEIGPYELRRIFPKEEIMMRNYRETYINIILFMESFINSVGFDAHLAGKGLTEEDNLQLRGIQKKYDNGRFAYSNLNQKIANISRILSGTAIDVNTEPFRSYQKNDVELRNQYVHSKGRILFTYEDWKAKCDELITSKCYEVLKAFWAACYGTRAFPVVIYNCFHGNSFKGIRGSYLFIKEKE